MVITLKTKDPKGTEFREPPTWVSFCPPELHPKPSTQKTALHGAAGDSLLRPRQVSELSMDSSPSIPPSRELKIDQGFGLGFRI